MHQLMTKSVELHHHLLMPMLRKCLAAANMKTHETLLLSPTSFDNQPATISHPCLCKV
jgi:hypothetical protein